MWMLVTTLCLQTSVTTADCQREAQGPYVVRMACRERAEGQKEALEALADDLSVKVLFISVTCQEGRDG